MNQATALTCGLFCWFKNKKKLETNICLNHFIVTPHVATQGLSEGGILKRSWLI